MSNALTDPQTKVTAQSYLRLLRYTVPYRKRLILGILCGILVGSSLYASLLLIPQLVGLVDTGGNIGSSGEKRTVSREEAVKLREIAQTPGLDDRETEELMSQALSTAPDEDPKLTRLLKQAEEVIAWLHLPCTIKGHTFTLKWPVKKSFDIVAGDGRIAWQLFAIYIVSFVVVWGLRGVASYLHGYFTRYVGIRVVADMRSAIFTKLTNQSLRFYGEMDVGHLISRCTNDTSALEYSVSHSIEDLTSAPLQVLGCLAATIHACHQSENYALVIMLGLGLGLVIVPIQVVSRKVRKYYKRSFARIADVFSRMHEVFSGIRAVKAFHAEEREITRFNAVNRKYYRQAIRAMRLHILFTPLMELVGVAATLLFLLYSYKCGITFTELSALLPPAIAAFRPLKDISKAFAGLQQSMAAAERYFALLDTDMSLPEKPDAVELAEFKEGIKVRDVRFSYDERVVLDGVSFDIPRGSMIAVVGETGSGKSTMANLLARFYDVDSGSITIDGVDIRDYRIASLRHMIGVVTQIFFWTPTTERCWYYGTGVDGAAQNVGLLQGTRGARCFYLPARKKCSDMEANVSIVPAKTAGQGFGSATGQYMDIGIKFDPATLTGYALRIQRTTERDNACAFSLVEYINGKVTPLTEQQYSSCYRGNVEVSLSLKGSTLTAKVGNGTSDQEISLTAAGVNVTGLKGFYIQHTGTAGPSASLIKHVQLNWK